MSGSADSAGVQTWPAAGAVAVVAVPLPDEVAAADEHPHPGPLPQAGEGAGASPPQTALPPLPLAGEGRGEGTTGAADTSAPAPPAHAAIANPTTTAQTVQPAPFAAPQSNAGMVGTTVLTLLLVIGFILLLAWLAKRMPGIGGASNPALKIVGSLPLGPRERVVVVAVGETQLLLATGPNGTRTLHTLDTPLPATPASTSPFAQVLAQQFGKKKS